MGSCFQGDICPAQDQSLPERNQTYAKGIDGVFFRGRLGAGGIGGAGRLDHMVVTLVNQNTQPYGMHMVVDGPGGKKTAYALNGHTASVTYYDTAYFQEEHVYGYSATIYVDGTSEPLGVVYFRVVNMFSIYPQVDSVEVTETDGHVVANASASPVIRYEALVTIYAPR